MKYDWERFLCTRGGSYTLDHEGYLSVPEGRYAKMFPRGELLRPTDVGKIPCVVILGEPGIGKSTILRDMQQAHSSIASDSKNPHSLFMNLSSFGQEERLINAVFRAPEIQAWIAGSYDYYLFLDSLDEALIRIDTLTAILVEQLKALPTERLFLRLSCRTGLWPAYLEEELKEIWHDSDKQSRNNTLEKSQDNDNNDSQIDLEAAHETDFVIFEIAPLRKIDVAAAAEANNLDSEAFLNEINARVVVPLAIVPITLNFLLRAMKSEGTLPERKWDLYRKGCLRLCSENDRQRLTPKLRPTLDRDQRMLIAGYIAFVMMMCRRNTIYTGDSYVELNDSEIGRTDFNVTLPVAGETRITSAHVTEVLEATGLFSSRGSERVGWIHQTFLEFLAAWFTEHIELPERQLVDLLTGKDQHIIPQLATLSLWMALHRPSILMRIVNPLVA
ncbi:MAG: ATP-binding protein [Candidatus Hydrogenedentes bacterium]|nr:ATP-binding protein [Candidatus Hydrogenedentota bacterium]